MKNKKNNMARHFTLSNLFAIALIVLGIHFMIAYQAKVLPFGIITDSSVIWGSWGWFGWAFSIFFMAAGATKLFEAE